MNELLITILALQEVATPHVYNMGLKEYGISFLAGSVGFSYLYFTGKFEGQITLMFAHLSIVVGLVFFVIPFVIEYFQLSIKTGYFITWMISMFIDNVMDVVRAKFKKLEE